MAPEKLTSGEVAQILGISQRRVLDLDDTLKPSRVPHGKREWRMYDRDRVDALAAQRDRKRDRTSGRVQ